MNTLKTMAGFGLMMVVAGIAWAQAQGTPVGPGRITCANAKSCELTIGSPASLRYKIDPAALQAADKERLAKCTAKAAACIATVTGTEEKGGVKASGIKFFN